jgi:hypothetical protein
MRYSLPHDPCPDCTRLVGLTISVGIDEITDDTWREFWVRMHMLGIRDYAPKQVRAHVGLKTNSVPLTRARFKNRMVKNMRWMAEDQLRKMEGENVV